MLDIRQRAVNFGQDRRDANTASALLDMEGGNAAVAASKGSPLRHPPVLSNEAGRRPVRHPKTLRDVVMA
jgi:hypothetical protein